MRSLIFNCLFWATSGVFAVTSYLCSFVLPRRQMMQLLIGYGHTVRFFSTHVMGIEFIIRGNPPKGEKVIMAGKHQCYADGIYMLTLTGDTNFIIGNEIEKFPMINRIVRKAGGSMVNHFGKTHTPCGLEQGIERSKADERPVLIYPEGGLAPVGETWRYRKGVYKLYHELERNVIPVATNMGLRWQAEDWTKSPGPAVIEFMDPIPTGMDRPEFMQLLETTIETRTRELELEGQS